ncbi:peptidoglycan-binding domain-containing protein [Rhodobacter calidifons]|uniref:Peptidoglycan-binding protein n=1 Tax=Rhodobacter calidifons TaxID=2715277 RepID=A0ABX0G5A1_9RHOB|nr:peptidoglycan-binding domain-containing protein [Rhodobacter calidifons]NHB76427.1 peptidoglycan-binding protein [Rhodobacter calidifons]
MQRRSILLSLSAFLTLAPGLQAGGDALQAAFESLSPAARRSAQEQLAMAGFYRGGIDGAYGPGTRKALVQAAAFIEQNSYGRTRFDLASEKGARTYLRALAAGDLGKYLWGEGDEADG